MRFFYLCLFIVPFFVSCSDSEILSTPTEHGSSSSMLYHKDVDVLPSNKLNPYDVVGQLHNELVTTFYAQDTLPTSLSAISSKVVSMAQNNTNFAALGSYTFNSSARVSYLLSHSGTCQQEVLGTSLVGASARSSLSNFIDSLISLCAVEDDYNVIYASIVAYENAVLSDSSYSTSDKKVMLVTTSVARHAAYLRKKRPKKNRDPEWNYMVTNIVAATDGAPVGFQEAVMRAVVVGIVENR